MLTAFKIVDEATRFLKKESREFEKIYAQTEKFVSEVNDLLLPREIELILTDKLKSNRKRRTLRFHDEMAADERDISDSVNTNNVIMDRVV